jgi:hypothetical protein
MKTKKYIFCILSLLLRLRASGGLYAHFARAQGDKIYIVYLA